MLFRSIAVLVGGTGPLQGGQTYSSAGLRHLIFGIQLGDSAQVRLVLGTQSAEEAERRRDSMPAFLSAFTASDNGYSQLLKRFLEATPVVEKDNIVLQQTYTAQEVGSYFRKKPLNE